MTIITQRVGLLRTTSWNEGSVDICKFEFKATWAGRRYIIAFLLIDTCCLSGDGLLHRDRESQAINPSRRHITSLFRVLKALRSMKPTTNKERWAMQPMYLHNMSSPLFYLNFLIGGNIVHCSHIALRSDEQVQWEPTKLCMCSNLNWTQLKLNDMNSS